MWGVQFKFWGLGSRVCSSGSIGLGCRVCSLSLGSRAWIILNPALQKRETLNLQNDLNPYLDPTML